MSRVDWDSYFMKIAQEVSTRATCDRLHVGCVLVRDKCIVSTGYNGSARGLPHCDDEGHDILDSHCVRTVHAEANAVAQAAREGARTLSATAYITHTPCWNCCKLLINAGIARIVYGGEYRLDERSVLGAAGAGVPLEQTVLVGAGEPSKSQVEACIVGCEEEFAALDAFSEKDLRRALVHKLFKIAGLTKKGGL